MRLRLEVHPAAIEGVAGKSLEEGVAVKDMLSAPFLAGLAAQEARWRQANAA